MDLGDMREFKYTIRDKRGFHAQPAGFFVREAGTFPCAVRVVRDGKTADGKKVFAVLGLGVRCGQEIVLETEGDQEEEAMISLSRFLRENL